MHRRLDPKSKFGLLANWLALRPIKHPTDVKYLLQPLATFSCLSLNWYAARFFRQTSINHLPYGVYVTFAFHNLRFHIVPFSQADFPFNFLPKKFICIPVQLIVCFIAPMYQLSRVFISCMISGVTNGFGFAFIYSLDRSVFVEDIKKQDTVHLHLITNDKNIPAT